MWLRKKVNEFKKHSNWVPWVTQAAVLRVDYLHFCPKKRFWYQRWKISEIISSVPNSLLLYMEVYPLEASLLDIFNFCIARVFPIIDPDFAKGGHFYTVLQSNSAIKKSHCYR